MTYILDIGALIAADRRDPRLTALLMVAASEGQPVRVAAGVIAQPWRGGSRQAALSRLLDSVGEVALDSQRSRRVGALLADAGTSDVVDASVIELARHGDVVLTSDPDDIEHLANVAGTLIRVVRV